MHCPNYLLSLCLVFFDHCTRMYGMRVGLITTHACMPCVAFVPSTPPTHLLYTYNLQPISCWNTYNQHATRREDTPIHLLEDKTDQYTRMYTLHVVALLTLNHTSWKRYMHDLYARIIHVCLAGLRLCITTMRDLIYALILLP